MKRVPGETSPRYSKLARCRPAAARLTSLGSHCPRERIGSERAGIGSESDARSHRHPQAGAGTKLLPGLTVKGVKTRIPVSYGALTSCKFVKTALAQSGVLPARSTFTFSY